MEGLRQTTAAVLTTLRVDASLRNALQDVLWNGQGPVIVERTRRTLAAAIDIDDLAADSDRHETMLDRWWVLGTPGPFAGLVVDNDTASAFPFGTAGSMDRLRKDIQRQVFGNRDWSAVQLFEELGAFDAVDRRFAGFVDDLVSHRVVVDEDRRRRIVEAMTPALREARLELRETGTSGGYLVFRLITTGAASARPKNVIFGPARKPTCESATPSTARSRLSARVN